MIYTRTVLRIGLLWGLIALVFAVVRIYLGPVLAPIYDALAQVGLQLEWFAMIMAGVHFGVLSEGNSVLDDMLGGGLAGVFVAIVLLLINWLLGGTVFTVSNSLILLATAFVVGAAGGVAGEIIDRD